MATEVFNYILNNGPLTADEIIANTGWGAFQVDEAIALLQRYHYIVQTSLQEGKPLYDLPVVNIEGE